MFKNVTLKTIYSLRWLMAGWTIGIMLMALITIALFDSFSQTGIKDIVETIPPELQSLVGNADDFMTIAGFIGQQVFGPNLYMLTIIMAILIFIGISIREEEQGNLQSLLAFPISRTRVYIEKMLGALAVITVVVASIALALWLGLMSISHTADFGRIWQSVLNLYIVTAVYGLIAYALAMGTGKKGLTMLVVSVYAVASFLLTTLVAAVDILVPYEKFSLLHYYNSPQIMTHGIHLSHVFILLAIGAVIGLAGWYGFIKRDVRSE